MPLFIPEWVRVLVAGEPANTMGLAIGLHMGGRNRQFVTKKLQLPANWDKLVEKYRNLVPTYVRY